MNRDLIKALANFICKEAIFGYSEAISMSCSYQDDETDEESCLRISLYVFDQYFNSNPINNENEFAELRSIFIEEAKKYIYSYCR